MDEGDFDIALIGEGASTDTVPVEALFAIVHAYLVALRKVADENKLDLGPLEGVELVNTSATARAKRVPITPVRAAAQKVVEGMNTPGAAELPHFENLAATLRKWLPPGWRLATAVANDQRQNVPMSAAKRRTFAELTTRRVRIDALTIVGDDTKITVFDRRQNRRYALECDRAILGDALGKIAKDVHDSREVHADVRARLVRDAGGDNRILGGEVLSLTLVGGSWTVDGVLDWYGSAFRPDST